MFKTNLRKKKILSCAGSEVLWKWKRAIIL